MQIIEQIEKTREYLDYIEDHIFNVKRAWIELQEKCQDMDFIYDDFLYEWIGGEVVKHDLSKMSESEFIQYRKAFYPTESESKGDKYDMTFAWEHHKKHNPHHWENWAGRYTVLSHPDEWKVHCVHMICDWMAMGYKFGDTAQAFYESGKEKIIIPDYAIDYMYEIFNRIEA